MVTNDPLVHFQTKGQRKKEEENNILLNQHSVYDTEEGGGGGQLTCAIIEECPASLVRFLFQLRRDVDQFICDERPPSCHVQRFAYEQKIGNPSNSKLLRLMRSTLLYLVRELYQV